LSDSSKKNSSFLVSYFEDHDQFFSVSRIIVRLIG
jgi:hypothetical protein